MLLPTPRGPLSEQVLAAVRETPEPDAPVLADVTALVADATDDDLQITLWTLYELHYRGFTDVGDEREWDPGLLAVRRLLEARFEDELRRLTEKSVQSALEDAEDLTAQLEKVIEDGDAAGPSLAGYLLRQATRAQYLEFLTQRSVYHLKESDPHAWVVARLDGPEKVALAELQYDEFGSGRPENLHSHLFAEALRASGLDDSYGAYVDVVPSYTLAVNNAMSLFGLHRRLRGAAMGHLAAFEATSPIPCRRYSGGADRLELGPAVMRYFDEHVEADAVHEHLAIRGICGALVDRHPELHEDVLVGAAACVQLDAVAGNAMIQAWDEGGSTLRGTEEREVA